LTSTRPRPSPYGAYAFNDTITTNVTVNWNWVRLNLPWILKNKFLIETAAAALGFPLSSSQLVYLNANNGPLNFPLNLNLIFPNTSALNTSALASTFKRFNISTSAANLAPFQGATVTGGDLTYDIQTGKFEVSGIKATSRNSSLALPFPNITLGSNQIVNFLPRGSQRYMVQLPTQFTLLHNTSSSHAERIFNGELVAAAFRVCSPHAATPGATTPKYLVKNHPLPITAKQALEIKVILSIFASLFILVPLCYIPASFVSFVVKERTSKSKHLQLVSGVSPFLYWISTYIWDFSLYTVLTALMMAAFFVYGRQSAQVFISTNDASTCVFLLVWLYGASSIPLSYIYSFAFENHSTAQISIMAINFVTGG